MHVQNFLTKVQYLVQIGLHVHEMRKKLITLQSLTQITTLEMNFNSKTARTYKGVAAAISLKLDSLQHL